MKFKVINANGTAVTLQSIVEMHNCLRRPLGRPRITWMKTIQQDLKSSDLNMDDAVDLAQNRPLWRLMSVWRYALLVVLARNDDDDEWK